MCRSCPPAREPTGRPQGASGLPSGLWERAAWPGAGPWPSFSGERGPGLEGLGRPWVPPFQAQESVLAPLRAARPQTHPVGLAGAGPPGLDPWELCGLVPRTGALAGPLVFTWRVWAPGQRRGTPGHRAVPTAGTPPSPGLTWRGEVLGWPQGPQTGGAPGTVAPSGWRQVMGTLHRLSDLARGPVSQRLQRPPPGPEGHGCDSRSRARSLGCRFDPWPQWVCVSLSPPPLPQLLSLKTNGKAVSSGELPNLPWDPGGGWVLHLCEQVSAHVSCVCV